MRVGSCNRKGLFTRERTPKLAAHYFKQRWAEKQPNDCKVRYQNYDAGFEMADRPDGPHLLPR